MLTTNVFQLMITVLPMIKFLVTVLAVLLVTFYLELNVFDTILFADKLMLLDHVLLVSQVTFYSTVLAEK